MSNEGGLKSIGHQLKSIDHQLKSIGHQLTGIGHQLTGIGHQLTGIGHQLTGIGHQLTGIGHQLTGIGHQLTAEKFTSQFGAATVVEWSAACVRYQASASGRKTAGSKPGNEYEPFLVSRRELALIALIINMAKCNELASCNIHAACEPEQRIKQLINKSTVKIDSTVPLRRYFRAGEEMERMALNYYEEKNYEQALILYMRFMVLFLEEISKHPEYSTFSQELKRKNNKKCMNLLVVAEKLKTKLSQQYEVEHNKFLEQQAEIKRRAQEEQEEAERLRKLKEAETPTPSPRSLYSPTDDISPSSFLPSAPPPSASSSLSPYENDAGEKPSDLYPACAFDAHPSAPEDSSFYSPRVGEIAVAPVAPSRSLKPQPSGGSSAPPTVDRSNKPLSLLGGSSGVLRRVRIPSSLVRRFLTIAAANTSSNVETCGVLSGVVRQSELCTTHLLIPEQSGTSDSCTTYEEERLFDVQDKHGIITLGWIHTHPSQTAFLSSVDLHTHCSYQLMMPEAVAVVCAPKYNDNSVFSLTPDHGLGYIANCRETGFHPHPSTPPLFKEADHVIMDEHGDVEIVDLRH
ncbi:USP8 dimerization domain [Trinorchestia longiramus]|nr:USP8 dimerization domain [Trinorchestia longiramus]